MRGIVLMVMAIALLSTMDALAKWLVTEEVPAIQILALRSIVIVPLILLVFLCRGRLAELKPKKTLPHLYRALVGFTAPFAFFLGIKHIPLTDAVVVFFSSIFTIALLSNYFLGEEIGRHRWASIVIGFFGVLIVAGPKGGGELHGYMLVLLGSTSYAILFVSGRFLSATESVASLVFSFNLGVGAISFAILPFYWQPLSGDQYGLMLLLALFAVSGHFLITTAFATAEASLIAPFEYTAVIWAIAFDLIVWQVVPAASTALGAVVIICSGLYIAYRERINQSKRSLPAA
ncbi:MAG: DMT family transporter [Granulosicoccus sp.]